MAGLRIKDRHPSQRPRERLWQFGAPQLSDEELLAILLGSGTADESATDVAARLLSEGLVALSQRPPAELVRWSGVGPAKAAVVRSAFELGRRAFRDERQRPWCRTSEEAYRLTFPHVDRDRESLFVLGVDTRRRLIGLHRVSMGGTDWTAADPADVFRRPVRDGARAVYLAHNHPSGDSEPSEADLRATERLAACGEILDIRLLDHLVLGDHGYVSVHRHMQRGTRKEPKRV